MTHRMLAVAAAMAAVLLQPLPAAADQTTRPAARAATERGPMLSYLVGKDLPEDLAAYERAGRLADAEAWLDARTSAVLEGGRLQAIYKVERERLRRLRREFSRTPSQMLDRLREAIPDVAPADLERWRNEGVLQWLEIDGEVRYFRREPSNLFRFSEDARARRDAARSARDGNTTRAAAAMGDPAGDPAAASRTVSLPRHAAEALAAARDTGSSVVLPVRFRARHEITLKPGIVPAGEVVRCWLPLAQEYRHQTDVRIVATTPAAHLAAPNGVGQRTVLLEQPAAADGSAAFVLEQEYTAGAFVPLLDAERVRYEADDPVVAQYTVERLPHLPLNAEVRALAAQIVGAETNPLRKAERIWRWMQDNIRYSSELEYCVLPSVVEKIMAERHGDCGVQALLFIALCRASGVAARWQSGWVTRPASWNMHDWAEFYAPPYGWLPADPSIGYLKSDDPAVKDFLFGHMDAYRFVANLDWETDFDPPKRHWRSDPVDNQRGELEWRGGNLYYDDWDYRVTVEPVQR
ncbi:MAG: transglutaminase-like domain-containing protein [Candidatus Sumerlaeaceae bacterium]|nr:transglutaminase-like domain-containing protein [Candidatus Sumerlaeaceae bacterium]